MWKLPITILSLLLAAFAIQVPIVVKDTSGFGASNFPTSVVIPLPYGKYQDVNTFRISDSSHATIPCQFNVQTRWAAKDNSIREVVAHFLATVGPYTTSGTGVSTYYFSDDGNGNVSPSSNAISVSDSTGAWTISNGLISMQVRKDSFTTISSLTLNGNPILTSSGGVLVDPKGNFQNDSSLPVFSAEIEENGPVRSVVKVTAISKFSCVVKNETGCKFPMQHCAPGQDVQVQHGFAVRIYAYAGQPFVKVDYQLRNTPFSALVNGYALYFDEMRIDFALSLSSTSNVTIGKGDGTVYTSQVTSTGTQLYQDFPIYTNNVYRIRDASTLNNLFTGNVSNGFVDVSDSNGGVMAFIRNFWQSWPNGISVQLANSQIRMSVELFPKGGEMLNYNGAPDPSGVYWLDDMQHVYKEFYIYPHNIISSSQMISMASTFQWFPVAVLPASWYRNTSVTLDLGGFIPIQQDPTDSDTSRNLQVDQLKAVASHSVNSSYYSFHWRHFGSYDPGYRDTSCTTGGSPYSVSSFLVTGSTKDYFNALDKGMGEINTRPQWMAPEQYKFDWNMPYNNPGSYCGVSWRFWCNSDRVQVAAPWMNVTRQRIINPRDDEHGWFYHALESYSITGNLWLKDWYTFVGQFRMTRLYENSVLYPDRSSRATGHALNHAVQAFRVTGDKSLLDGFIFNVRNFRKPYMDPRYGCNNQTVEELGAGYQTGYYMRAMVDYMEEISDPQAWAEAFQVLAGMVNWNQHFGHFPYYYQAATQPVGASGSSSGTSFTLVDPVAWYYYHTGWEQYRDIIVQYVKTGVPGYNGTAVVPGVVPYYDFTAVWNGDFTGRLAYNFFRNNITMPHDTRPAKISDLTAYLDSSNNTLSLLWTTPANAVKFHFVWSTVPISENQTIAAPSVEMNWWAANAIGSIIAATPGQQQTVSFPVNGTGSFFAAVFTWDSIGNMSPMSNLAWNTNATFPAGVTTTSSQNSGSTTGGENQVNLAYYIKPSVMFFCALLVLLFISC